tara:strand:+ start:29 stop:388 length:360 start_codon:yes stop_codon:yes gene_type:complete
MSNLTKFQIELLIDEQRNLLKSNSFDREVCHYNMNYLKTKSNLAGRKKSMVDTNLLTQPNICCVCMESHNFNDLICTECDHFIGKECYKKWIQVSKTCPYCRKENPLVRQFVENNLKLN